MTRIGLQLEEVSRILRSRSGRYREDSDLEGGWK